MTQTPINPLSSTARSQWVRLRTLINLRWLTIAGQSGAVLFATGQLGLSFNIGLCVLAIGAAVAFNIVSWIIYPENKRLSERETTLALLFDLIQLGFLLFVTGGLNNPFAVLVLVPATIAAAALRLSSTIFLGAATILLISVLTKFHLLLMGMDGRVVQMPVLLTFGFWISLIIGVIFMASYTRRIALETHSMTEALVATQMALDREQKLTDLGGVVAAAAHELGTPLATIKLASSELLDELEPSSDLFEDVMLIRDQANRCRDILHDMGRTGKDDMLMRHAPVSAIVHEAAEPHENRGKTIVFWTKARDGTVSRQPEIRRQPEIIHGIRNLVQNAVDFAQETVWVDVEWSERIVRVIVADDGHGYPGDLIGRLGEPFMRRRPSRRSKTRRPGYDGMGLGLFIAKTLLERSGAEVAFTNGADPFLNRDEIPDRCGAIVTVTWLRVEIEREKQAGLAPLGQNKRLEI